MVRSDDPRAEVTSSPVSPQLVPRGSDVQCSGWLPRLARMWKVERQYWLIAFLMVAANLGRQLWEGSSS